MNGLSEDARQKPPFAPDIACEVQSPKDRNARITRKTELSLAHGAIVVLNVDPQERSVRLTTGDGERVFHPGDAIEHHAFPGLHVPIAEIFAPLDRLR